jgi:hypothetical protein
VHGVVFDVFRAGYALMSFVKCIERAMGVATLSEHDDQSIHLAAPGARSVRIPDAVARQKTFRESALRIVVLAPQ